MRPAASLFAVVSCLTALAAAQAAQRAAGFEVSSVRRNTSSTPGSASAQPGGGFTATNQSLRRLVAAAYSLPLDRVIGGPDWLDSERYDIAAKGGDQANEQRSLQALLRDRFSLVLRTEQRNYPAYHLVTATTDGKTGPRLRPARVDCRNAETRAAAAAAGVDAGKPPACGILQRPGRILAGSVPLDMIVGYLGTGRPVLNRTGLKGQFDVDLEWAPTADSDGVSIFTAVREQLGLRLESASTVLDVIIIERAERPTPN